jgi:phosphotransferase system  glucose/maltose/N-acetylglucosamine-specific IIC component
MQADLIVAGATIVAWFIVSRFWAGALDLPTIIPPSLVVISRFTRMWWDGQVGSRSQTIEPLISAMVAVGLLVMIRASAEGGWLSAWITIALSAAILYRVDRLRDRHDDFYRGEGKQGLRTTVLAGVGEFLVVCFPVGLYHGLQGDKYAIQYWACIGVVMAWGLVNVVFDEGTKILMDRKSEAERQGVRYCVARYLNYILVSAITFVAIDGAIRGRSWYDFTGNIRILFEIVGAGEIGRSTILVALLCILGSVLFVRSCVRIEAYRDCL